MKDDQRIIIALAAEVSAKLPPSAKEALLIALAESIGALSLGALTVLRASQLSPEWGIGIIRALAPPEGALADIDRAARRLIESLPVSFTEDVPS